MSPGYLLCKGSFCNPFCKSCKVCIQTSSVSVLSSSTEVLDSRESFPSFHNTFIHSHSWASIICHQLWRLTPTCMFPAPTHTLTNPIIMQPSPVADGCAGIPDPTYVAARTSVAAVALHPGCPASSTATGARCCTQADNLTSWCSVKQLPWGYNPEIIRLRTKEWGLMAIGPHFLISRQAWADSR